MKLVYEKFSDRLREELRKVTPERKCKLLYVELTPSETVELMEEHSCSLFLESPYKDWGDFRFTEAGRHGRQDAHECKFEGVIIKLNRAGILEYTAREIRL